MGKPCQSSGCIYPIFSHNYCKFHQGKRTDEKYKSRKSISQTHIEKMKEKVNGNGVVEKNEDEEKMNEWFLEGMKAEKICDNCGKSLKSYNEKDWRGSQHHVLEKSLYPSVKTNPLNRLRLGKWCCHHVWHSSWERASQMRVFPKAIEIIKKLYPLLTRDERRKIPEVVQQELEPQYE